MIPETVASALWLFLRICCFPRSHSIAAIIIDDPVRVAPKKNMNMDIIVWFYWLHRDRPRDMNVEMMMPTMKTGDLIGSKSVISPIGMLPTMLPMSNMVKILDDTSLLNFNSVYK